jgi:hypothetical protein
MLNLPERFKLDQIVQTHVHCCSIPLSTIPGQGDCSNAERACGQAYCVWALTVRRAHTVWGGGRVRPLGVWGKLEALRTLVEGGCAKHMDSRTLTAAVPGGSRECVRYVHTLFVLSFCSILLQSSHHCTVASGMRSGHCSSVIQLTFIHLSITARLLPGGMHFSSMGLPYFWVHSVGLQTRVGKAPPRFPLLPCLTSFFRTLSVGCKTSNIATPSHECQY